MKRVLNVLLILCVLLSACTPAVAAPVAQILDASAEQAIAPDYPYLDPSLPVDARVEDLLARMSQDEKFGQMTQVEKNSISALDLQEYRIGSLLSGGGGSPENNTSEAWVEMVGGYQKIALGTPLGIPLIYGVDAVHGHNNLMNATMFPHNIGLGAANDPDLVRRIGQATAEEMMATGIPWSFAPVVAVPQDARWGRTYEGFSENTEIVTRLGVAYIEGMQSFPDGQKPTQGQTIFAAATAKHFIGDGGTTFGTSTTYGMNNKKYLVDQGDMQMNEQTVRALFLPPYKAAVDAGARTVMVSYSSWNGTKMHAQQYLITDVLKNELGFTGFVVSDWKAVDQIYPDDLYRSVVASINAGVDMVMVPQDYKTFIYNLRMGVQKGDISQERIDDAVRRVLRVKFELGLFEHPMPDTTALQTTIRSDAHLALAREAVQKSLVLLKNENQTLPIDKNTPLIFVAGKGAGTLLKQLGGWTINWQGDKGFRTEGTTVVDAINAVVGPDTKVVLNATAMFKSEVDASGNPQIADIGIVVVGESPYAEGMGDSTSLSLPGSDIKAIERMRERARKVVVIIFSGRPVIITDQLPLADAWVAAWLPGSEGAGVTDVLFGDVQFSGKLPYTWPRSIEQMPINSNNLGDKTGCDGPLFPFGYGLTTSDASPEMLVCE